MNGGLRGLRTFTPRVTFNGPLIANKLWFSQGAEYRIDKRRVLALTFPNNETVTESVNSFTQVDYVPNATHSITGTMHVSPRQAKFFNLDFFNQRPVTPNYRARDYTGVLIDRWTLGQNLLESAVSIKKAGIDVWAQGEREMTLTPVGNLGNYFNSQDRHSSRYELIETLSLKLRRLAQPEIRRQHHALAHRRAIPGAAGQHNKRAGRTAPADRIHWRQRISAQ